MAFNNKREWQERTVGDLDCIRASMHDVVDLYWLIREGRNIVHAEALISGVSANARQMASMIMRAAAGKRSLESRETWLSRNLLCSLKEDIILGTEDRRERSYEAGILWRGNT
jgi:hypothetical protein